MPRFFFHLQTDVEIELDKQGVWFPDVEHAYLAACASIPSLAAEFIAAGRNPIVFEFQITSEDGTLLLDVPFSELFRPPGRYVPQTQKPAVAASQSQELRYQQRLHPEMPSKRSQFTVSFKCPHCGQLGAAVWEEGDGMTPGPRGKRTFVQVTDGFHSEHGRTSSGDPMIVCNECDTIQED